MEFPAIWSAVWTNSLFHWGVLGVFLGAVFAESDRLVRYRLEMRQIQTSLEFLKQWQRDSTALPPEEIATWLSQHLQLDARGNPQQQRGLFLLRQYPLILQRSRRSSLRFVPGLCTAIGILGTFYGIQTGLQGVNLGFNNSSELLDGIKLLLIGMKTAFSSSLIGLGLGSAFTLVLFVSDTLRQNWRDRLRTQIERLFLLEASTEGSVEFSQSAIASAVGEQIASQLAPAFRDIANSFKVLEQIQAERELAELKTAIASISVQLDANREVTQQLAESVQNLSQNLTQLSLETANLQAKTLENLQQLHHRTVEILTQAESTCDRQSQTLETVGNEASSLMREAKTELIGGLQEMEEVLLNANQTLQDYLEQFSQTYQISLQDFFSQSTKIIESQRRAFREDAADVADSFQQLRQEFEEALQTRYQLERRLLEDLEKQVEKVFKRIEERE